MREFFAKFRHCEHSQECEAIHYAILSRFWAVIEIPQNQNPLLLILLKKFRPKLRHYVFVIFRRVISTLSAIKALISINTINPLIPLKISPKLAINAAVS